MEVLGSIYTGVSDKFQRGGIPHCKMCKSRKS